MSSLLGPGRSFRTKKRKRLEDTIEIDATGILDNPGEISDTWMSIQFFCQKWFTTYQSKYLSFPFLFRHQLSVHLSNHTSIDQELYELRQQSKIIMISTSHGLGLVRLEDYRTFFDRQEGLEDLNFNRHFLHYAQEQRPIDFIALARDMTGTSTDSKSSDAPELETHVRTLVSRGWIKRSLDSGYEFSIPSIGQWIRVLKRARVSISNMLRLAPYGQIRRDEILRKRWSVSFMPVLFHLEEMTGAQIIALVNADQDQCIVHLVV